MYFIPVKLQLACVSTDSRVGLAAQQLVTRYIQCLTFNIPDCNIQCTDCCLEDHAAALAALAPESILLVHLPETFIVHRIPADHQLCKIFYLAKSTIFALAISQANLTKSRDAFIGIYPHK